MNKRNYKFGYLLLGVFIGIFTTFSVFWWQGNNVAEWKWLNKFKYYYNNIFDRTDEKKIFSNEQNINSKKQKFTQQKPKTKKDTLSFSKIPIDNPDAWDEFIANYKGGLSDSLLIDSILKYSTNTTSTYNIYEDNDIKKDRLVLISNYIIPNFSGFTKNDSEERDSLFNHQKIKTPKEKNKLIVEFWESPINYKGYKTRDNKLVLFGVDDKEAISFILHNNIVYLKFKSTFYPIENSIDFKMLIPVNNAQLLNQLNNQ